MKEKKKLYVYGNDIYLNDEYKQKLSKNSFEIIKGTKQSIKKFIEKYEEFQLDTETNVTDFYTERVLYVLQLGAIDKSEQHVFDFGCDMNEFEDILKALFSSEKVFYAQNGKFEYKVIYKRLGVKINNFKDTYLAAGLLHAGISVPGQNSLSGLLYTYLGIELDKTEQTTFTGDIMTPDQLYYAVMDVIYLTELYDSLIHGIKRYKMNKLLSLENKALCALGDMEINGFLIDTKALDENIINFKNNAEKYRKEIIDVFMSESDDILKKIREGNFLQKEDEIIINWKSSTQKKAIFQVLYPDEDIKSTAKAFIIKLGQRVDNDIFIKWYLEENFEKIEEYLISRHLDFLIESEMFIPKGTINLNFNSPKQLLDFFRIWYPNLKGVGVKDLKKLRHPIIMAYKKYSKAQKLVSSFGEKMYNFIEKDGKIHTTFKQIVPSGSRMSSSKPNLQQAPSTEEFRRIYIPDSGWVLVDSDYSSMEMFIAAHLSGDKKLLYAIENGYDLHSYSAYQIFGQEWLDAGGDAEPKGKPATKEANAMRKKSKGLSFSLLYGTGPQAFGDNVGLTMNEAKTLMNKYFNTFPELAKFFKDTGELALKEYKVREPVFGRIRFFYKPTNGMEVSHLKNAAMNFKPQAINGSVLKYAMAMIRKKIIDEGLDDKVKVLLNVHDQIVTMVKIGFEKMWAKEQTKLMEKAADYAVPGGVIKAESEILKHWTKG